MAHYCTQNANKIKIARVKFNDRVRGRLKCAHAHRPVDTFQ